MKNEGERPFTDGYDLTVVSHSRPVGTGLFRFRPLRYKANNALKAAPTLRAVVSQFAFPCLGEMLSVFTVSSCLDILTTEG